MKGHIRLNYRRIRNPYYAALLLMVLVPALFSNGVLITIRKEPLFVGEGFPWNESRACSWRVFGLISIGDASVRKAMKAQRLGRVSLVEQSVHGGFGVYRLCTIVYGPFGDLGEPPNS